RATPFPAPADNGEWSRCSTPSWLESCRVDKVEGLGPLRTAAPACKHDRIVEERLHLSVDLAADSSLDLPPGTLERISCTPLLHLFLRSVGELHGALRCVMAVEAIRAALEEGRAASVSRTPDRAGGRLEHCLDVHSVDLLSRHSVRRGTLDKRAGGRRRLRKRDRIAVVL